MSEFTDAEIAEAESMALDAQIDDYLTGERERQLADMEATPDETEPSREAPPLTDLEHHQERENT